MTLPTALRHLPATQCDGELYGDRAGATIWLNCERRITWLQALRYGDSVHQLAVAGIAIPVGNWAGAGLILLVPQLYRQCQLGRMLGLPGWASPLGLLSSMGWRDKRGSRFTSPAACARSTGPMLPGSSPRRPGPAGATAASSPFFFSALHGRQGAEPRHGADRI